MAPLELAPRVAEQAGARTAKRLLIDLDRVPDRVGHENTALVHFQRHGTGVPRR